MHTKLCNLQGKLREIGIDMYVLSALDDIAWLLNLRGSDIPCNPFFYAFIVVTPLEVSVFIDADPTCDHLLKEHLKRASNSKEGPRIDVHRYGQFYDTLAETLESSYKVKLDQSCSYKIYSTCLQQLPSTQILCGGTLVADAKSVKNDVELHSLKEAHIVDAVALIRFFAWLDSVESEVTTLDEVDLATRLFEFRSEGHGFKGISFDTISAFGSNGAVSPIFNSPCWPPSLSFIPCFLSGHTLSPCQRFKHLQNHRKRLAVPVRQRRTISPRYN